jgi:flagellar biosynthetic protein FliO
MPAGSTTGSLLQTLFALIVVLAVLGALAWFLKRYGPKAGGGGANLRIVGSLNLGGRERLLVVEVGNQWIVVGHDAETGRHRRHGGPGTACAIREQLRRLAEADHR